MRLTYHIPASKYFSNDADTYLVKEGEIVIVHLDTDRETTEYAWFKFGDNPGNLVFKDDDYEGVVEFLLENSNWRRRDLE